MPLGRVATAAGRRWPGNLFHNLVAQIAGMALSSRPAELRIDVEHPPDKVQTELDALDQRMKRSGDALHGLAAIDLEFPGLVFRHREADGEHYIYAEDVARGCLAGYTVLNRLVELDRRADRHLRAPHSKYAAAYQRRGIATAVYRWWLDEGNCMISGARQSPGANALWRALARRYPLIYVDLRDKTLRYLGTSIDERVSEDLHTRMILLGKGWDLDQLVSRTGLRMDPPAVRAGISGRYNRPLV